MADYTSMDCTQLAAALATETDPDKRALIEAEMLVKACGDGGASPGGDDSGGGGNGPPIHP